MPASKSSVQIGGPTLLAKVAVSNLVDDKSTGRWVKLLSASIKTSEQKDLMIGVSLQCGLFTDTLVKSSGGKTATSTAEACVECQVTLDGKVASSRPNSGPGAVVFSRRSQTLMAQLGGIITDITVNADGTVSWTYTDEQIQVVLDTMEANHFDWLCSNVGAGDHVVAVEVRVAIMSNSDSGSAAAMACVGYGALDVEEIRLVKGATPVITVP